jgi:CheY-like chemotaxis protein
VLLVNPTGAALSPSKFPGETQKPLSPEVTAPQIVSYEGPRRKILIVHDEALNRALLRELVATVGFESVASSASVFTEGQRLARASGFTDFLPKPVLEEELFEILGRHLELKWVYAEVGS